MLMTSLTLLSQESDKVDINAIKQRLTQVLNDKEAIITKQSNVIANLEYEVYTLELTISNMTEIQEVDNQIFEATEKLHKLERVKTGLKTGSLSAAITAIGLTVIKIFLSQ